MKLTTAILAFALAFPATFLDAAPSEKIPPITIEGVLFVGEFFGPPNYGEEPDSDRIEHSYFLQLPAPISTQVQNSKSIESLTEQSQTAYFVQLVIFNREQSLAKQLVGKKVRVVGKTFQAETGHHRTHVLIEVQSLSRIKGWHW